MVTMNWKKHVDMPKQIKADMTVTKDEEKDKQVSVDKSIETWVPCNKNFSKGSASHSTTIETMRRKSNQGMQAKALQMGKLKWGSF